ncbi:MAG: OmpA family protein [Cellvibrionaceae bacterium]
MKFKRKLLVVAVTIAVAGCSSSKVFMPKSGNRIPVNNNENVIAYKKKNAELEQLIREKDSLRRELMEAQRASEEMEEHINELKAYILKSASIPKPPSVKWTRSQPEIDIPKTPAETNLDLSLFTVHHPFAETSFNPPADITTALIESSKNSEKVVVRGRTDANKENLIDKRIAISRAINAKRFLIDNGVEAEKIRIFYRSAGDNIADNATPEGRALNRRVVIEAYSPKTNSIAKVN